MANQSTENSENTSFYDQVDQTFNRKVNEKEIKLAKGVTSDEEEEETEFGGSPEQQVRETEDASLQDDTYSFDEANTANEEYHDADDAVDNHLENDSDLMH